MLAYYDINFINFIRFNIVTIIVDSVIKEGIIYPNLHNCYYRECNKTFSILYMETS